MINRKVLDARLEDWAQRWPSKNTVGYHREALRTMREMLSERGLKIPPEDQCLATKFVESMVEQSPKGGDEEIMVPAEEMAALIRNLFAQSLEKAHRNGS